MASCSSPAPKAQTSHRMDRAVGEIDDRDKEQFGLTPAILRTSKEECP
jgi:hypothetical protein